MTEEIFLPGPDDIDEDAEAQMKIGKEESLRDPYFPDNESALWYQRSPTRRKKRNV